MSNFYFSWKSCMKPWIIHKLGNFVWENCYRDITDVAVVQVIAAMRITPADENGFGGTALVHDNEMRLTCNFTEQAIRDFELQEESTSGSEFNADLKNALVALRRYRIVPTFTSSEPVSSHILSKDGNFKGEVEILIAEGDSIFTVVVYSFTLKSFTKLSAGIKDTRMAHKHYRIVKKLKELWSQWKNDRLAFVSDDSDSGSATTEVTLSQMIQFMEETEKMEEQKKNQNGGEVTGDKKNLDKNKSAAQKSGEDTRGDETKEIKDKRRSKESDWKSSNEGTSDTQNREAGVNTSVGRDKVSERPQTETVSQQATGASFEIPLQLLDKLRCSLHENCLHLHLLSPGDSSEADGETSSHSLNELLESIPVVHYTSIPESARQGLPEGLTPLDLDVPWDQGETSCQREGEVPISTSSSPVGSCDTSSHKASQSMEVLQWPPGSSSSEILQVLDEGRSVASLELSNKGGEDTDGTDGTGKESLSVEVSGDCISSQSEAQNTDTSKTNKVINTVNIEVINTKESVVVLKESQNSVENITTGAESQEEVIIMETQPFEIDEAQLPSKKLPTEMDQVDIGSKENLLPETQPFDIIVSTQSPTNKKGKPEEVADGDKMETGSQEFEPVTTNSEEILSNEHNKAFVETQSPRDSLKQGTQDSLPAGETDTSNSTDQRGPNSKNSAEAETGISSLPENTYNSDDSLEDIFDLKLTCASSIVGLESQGEKVKGNPSNKSNSPTVSSSNGQPTLSSRNFPSRKCRKGRVAPMSGEDVFQKARKSGSNESSKNLKAKPSRIDQKQDSDIPSSSPVPVSKKKRDDIDWSWILNSPADTQKLDELLSDSVSLKEPNEHSGEISQAAERNSQTSLVTEFLEELQTLQCKCGESLSDSCDSSTGLCQSSCQKDESKLNISQRQSRDKRASAAIQSIAGQSLQEINLSRPVSGSVGAHATSDRERLVKNPTSPSKKTRKRKYRKMTPEELSIPKKKMIEDRLLKWIAVNYAAKNSKT